MKIYVAHSTKFNYKEDLYRPLRESEINDIAEIILPHEQSDEIFNSKQILKEMDYVVAEVSYPSTGLGIELGWANLYNIPIILIHKSDFTVSDSVKSIAFKITDYSSTEDMIEKIKAIVL